MPTFPLIVRSGFLGRSSVLWSWLSTTSIVLSSTRGGTSPSLCIATSGGRRSSWCFDLLRGRFWGFLWTEKKGECCVDVLIVRRAPSKRANGFFVATDIVDGALFVSSQEGCMRVLWLSGWCTGGKEGRTFFSHGAPGSGVTGAVWNCTVAKWYISRRRAGPGATQKTTGK